jgi:DNA-binding response OmpR family regulator
MDLTTDTKTWRVLIVDDEPDNLAVASDFLGFFGATTAKAGDGQEGLDLLDSFKPNVILIDLSMPRMDGWELLRRLRAKPDLQGVPLMALTALTVDMDAVNVNDAGFDTCVTKPFHVQELLDAVKACIIKVQAKQVQQSQTAAKGEL